MMPQARFSCRRTSSRSLSHCRHGHVHDTVLFPARRHCFPLGVELNRRFAVEVEISLDRAPTASEAEHRQWYRNREVDANLSHVHLVLKLSGRSARTREKRGAVSCRAHLSRDST